MRNLNLPLLGPWARRSTLSDPNLQETGICDKKKRIALRFNVYVTNKGFLFLFFFTESPVVCCRSDGVYRPAALWTPAGHRGPHWCRCGQHSARVCYSSCFRICTRGKRWKIMHKSFLVWLHGFWSAADFLTRIFATLPCLLSVILTSLCVLNTKHKYNLHH